MYSLPNVIPNVCCLSHMGSPEYSGSGIGCYRYDQVHSSMTGSPNQAGITALMKESFARRCFPYRVSRDTLSHYANHCYVILWSQMYITALGQWDMQLLNTWVGFLTWFCLNYSYSHCVVYPLISSLSSLLCICRVHHLPIMKVAVHWLKRTWGCFPMRCPYLADFQRKSYEYKIADVCSLM